MGTPLSISDIGGMTKSVYAKDPKVLSIYTKLPTYTMISKVGNSGGSDYNMEVLYGDAVRVGADPSVIYGLAQPPPAAKFTLLCNKTFYGYSSFSGNSIAQCGDGSNRQAVGSVMNLIHAENMKVSKTMAKKLSLYLFGAGDGVVGTIDASTVVGSTKLVLTKPTQQWAFSSGQSLQLAATAGGAARTGTLVVASVPGDGSIILTGNITAGVAAAAVGDVVTFIGDGVTNIYPGFKAWCPFSATKGTLGGVNRDLAPMSLAGLFVDAAAEGLDLAAAISAGFNRFSANEGTATHGIINPKTWEMLNQLGSSQVTVDQDGERVFGFTALSFNSDGKTVKLFGDASCPEDECWLVDMGGLELRFVDEPGVNIEDRDGQTLRKATGGVDAFEITFKSYLVGVCLKDGAIPGRTLCGVKLF